jgi:hypothetical protein
MARTANPGAEIVADHHADAPMAVWMATRYRREFV